MLPMQRRINTLQFLVNSALANLTQSNNVASSRWSDFCGSSRVNPPLHLSLHVEFGFRKKWLMMDNLVCTIGIPENAEPPAGIPALVCCVK